MVLFISKLNSYNNNNIYSSTGNNSKLLMLRHDNPLVIKKLDVFIDNYRSNSSGQNGPEFDLVFGQYS